jgi:hypothetical protein
LLNHFISSHHARPRNVKAIKKIAVDILIFVKAHFSRKFGIEISIINAVITHKKIHFWDGFGTLSI